MKLITECNREERLERALMALECLSYMFDEGGIDAKEFSHGVYCISHVAPGRCGNPHEDWLKKIEEVEKAGKKFGIYNPEKAMQDRQPLTKILQEGWDG
jgi:hypothetical protein